MNALGLTITFREDEVFNWMINVTNNFPGRTRSLGASKCIPMAQGFPRTIFKIRKFRCSSSSPASLTQRN